jgi:SAM-dependent methyltransferase
MRFLVRFRNVARMTGVDATRTMVDLGRKRTADEGLANRISFEQADVCSSGLPGAQFDFVWGEDAWCYVEDKSKLIAEAARLTRPKGRIAFTDWMEGPTPLMAEEAKRYLTFMKFPNVLSLVEYGSLLETSGCAVRVALGTGRFASHVPLYIDMIEKQLTYDALKIIGFDAELAQTLLGEMRFMHALARDGKIIQGLIVAQKNK